MSAPSSVCAQQDFTIRVRSSAKIFFQLDFSTNNGSTWTSTGLTFFTQGSGTNFVKDYVGLSIFQTTRYRIRYTTDGYFTNPTPIEYEPSGGLTVTLFPTPIIANFPNTTTCGGTAFTVSPQPGNGNEVPTGTTYTWTVTNNAFITGASDQNTAQPNISQVLTNTTSATQTLTYTVIPTSGNGCAGDPFEVPVIVNPTPQFGTLTATTICSDQTLSFTPVDGTDGIVPAGTTYTWTVDANANITGETGIASPQNSIGLNQTLRNETTTLQTVVYHVTPTSSLNCVGTTFTLNAPVNPIPYIGPKSYSICSNNAFNYSPAGGDKIPAGTTYTWTVASNTNVTGQSNQTVPQSTITQTLLNTTTTLQTVVYTVTPITPAGCVGPTFTITITITPTPLITDKTPIVCSGGSFSIQPMNGVDNDIVPPGTAYTWTVALNSNVTGQSNQSTGQLVIAQTLVNLTNTDQHVIYTVTSTTANGCLATTFQIDVTVVPTAVIGPKLDAICSGYAFSVTPTNGNGDIVLAGTRYTWTVVDNPNISGDVDETTPRLSVSQTLTNNTIVPQTVVYTATSNSTNGCASTTFTVTVTVNPSPQIGAKTPAAICSGLSFNVLPVNGVNGDVVPVNTTYTWIVSTNANVTGQSNQPSAQNSISQTLTNVSDAVQTLTYTVTSGSPGCVGSIFTITVVVNPRPSISAKTPAAICSGSSFSVSPLTGSGELVPVGTTYSWTISSNPNITGQSNQNGQTSIGQTLTNLTNTNQELIYTVAPITSLGCDGPSFLVTVTVKPGSTIENKSLAICSETSFNGTPVNGTDIVPDNTTYTWTVTTNANISGASNQSAQQGTVAQLLTNLTSAAQTLTYTVTPSLVNACAPSIFTILVTVNPKPVIANINNVADIICSGTSFSETPTDGTDKVPVGTKYTWTVSSSTFISGQSDINVGQSFIGQLLNNLTNSNKSLTYTVTPTTQVGCIGSNFQVSVTVKPTATISNKTQIICSEASFLLTPTNDGTDIIPSSTRYTWVPVTNSTITGALSQTVGQTNITQALTNLTSGNQTQTYTITPVLQNGCSAATFTVSITVKPKPNIANITTTVCSVSPFLVNPIDGAGGNLVPSNTLYTWVVGSNTNLMGQSDQNTPQSNISQTIANSTSITQPIYYTIIPTAANCAGPQFTLRVDVKATPNITAFTPDICSGTSFEVMPNNVGNIVPAGTTYTWNVVTNPNLSGYANQTSGLDRISQLLNNLKNTNQVLDYNVTATTLESCASTFSITVGVKPVSVIANKTAAICTGAAFNVTPVNGTDIVPSGTTYTWTVLPNTNISGKSNQLSAQAIVSQSLTNSSTTAQVVTYSVSAVLNNGCLGANYTALITVNPLPVISINASSNAVCAGDPVKLTAVGGVTYAWDNGISDGIDFVPTNTTNYTVTGTDVNGCVNTASQNIIVNAHPVVTVTNTNVDRCGTGALTLTASTDIGTVKWYDLLSGGALLGSGNNLNISSLATSTAFYADALSSEGCYAITRKQVNAVIKEIPSISSVVNNFNCGPGSITLKAFPTAGVVNWYANSTSGTSLRTATTYTTASLNRTTIYYVDATFNNCTTLERVPVIATVDTIPIISTTNPSPVCFPLTQDITTVSSIVLANSSITYSYWKDINATQPITSPSLISISGTYYIKATDVMNCYDIKPVNAVINPLPASPIVTPIAYCQNDIASLLVAKSLLAHTLKWYETNPAAGTASLVASIPATDIVGNQNYYVSQVNDLTNCESPRAALQVTTHALPTIAITSAANPICYADSLILTASGASTYVWDKDVINNAKFKIIASDRFTVIGTDLNGCKNTNYIDQVVNPLPIVKPISGLTTICNGATVSLLNNVSVGLAPYNFVINSDSASITYNAAGNLFAKKAGLANISYKVIDAYGCVSEISLPFQIAVNDPIKPKIFFQEAFYDLDTKINTKVDLGYTFYDWTPRMNLNFYNDKEPIFRGTEDITYALYRLDAVSNCSVTDTYNVTITTNFIFDLPNVFTPNADGLNDIIKAVYNSGIKSLNYLKIYNRKGNIVFQTSQLTSGWDGKLNGVDQEPDAFYWIAEYVTKKNETFRKSGSFLLIK